MLSLVFLREEMDLVNYILLIGKIYIWDCRRKANKPVIAHIKQILKINTTQKGMLQKSKKSNNFLKTSGMCMKTIF